MEWMIMPLKRYADFSGRSRRKEYWMFVLFQILVLFPLMAVGFVLGDLSDGGEGGSILFLLLVGAFGLVFFIPSLAVQVRRFHDQDKSGWFVLLGLIPYLGGLILFIFMCLEGTRGHNRFGADPKDPYGENVFE
jgi:uncharacterized membrane protein YhaH (DUF805 family)